MVSIRRQYINRLKRIERSLENIVNNVQALKKMAEEYNNENVLKALESMEQLVYYITQIIDYLKAI